MYEQVENDSNPYDIGVIGCTEIPTDLGPILPVEDTCSSFIDEPEKYSECNRGYNECVAKKQDALVNFD